MIILAKFVDDLFIHVDIENPFDIKEIAMISIAAVGFNSIYERWSIPHDKIVKFLNDQRMYIRHILDSLDNKWHQKIVEAIDNLLIIMIERIRDIQVEWDNQNNPAEDLPLVLSHELVKLRTAEFDRIIVDRHLVQLRESWDEATIAQIEEQHRLLHITYDRDVIIKSTLNSENNIHSFEMDWALIEGFELEIQVLRDFCGGIAIVSVNIAIVESDFSILGWEKDEYRKCLFDLALEDIMHSKQFELLGNLAWRWFSGQIF